MFDSVHPELIKPLIGRCGGAIAAGTPRDCWLAYLQSQTGVSGTIADLEKRFLRSKGGSGETIRDITHSYLAAKGYAGSFKDKLHSFCKSAVAF